MPRHSRSFQGKLPDLNFVLLVVMLVVLWIAGGASRADVLGQTVVRAVAWFIAITGVLFLPRPQLRPVAPVALILFGAIGMVALQLILLPPSIWIELPGREIVVRSAIAAGESQPWRPISLSPSYSVNSLSSLIVPTLVLFLMAGLQSYGQKRLLLLLLGMVVASSFIGMLQFSGSHFNNPLINDVSGAVSGTFANRNHFALFLACGCVFAPAWAFYSSRDRNWKAIAAIGMVAIFVLLILATGSRMGMVLGAIAVSLGLFSVWSRVMDRVRRLPRRYVLFALASIAGLFLLVIALSIFLGRAVSIDRIFAVELSDDLRRAALPTVWQMVQVYWPVGSGFGAFDPVYRIHEHDNMLSPLYLNHAHNDWLEVILDGGLLGLLILIGASIWWLLLSLRVWRKPLDSSLVLPRVGSSIMLLIAFASLVDYPARTPLVMAILVISATWLSLENYADRHAGAEIS